MASIFSSSNKNRHQRSRSEVGRGSKEGKERSRAREPLVDFTLAKDVATLVCVELSKAILTSPSANIGVYFRTVFNSRKDISVSDASIILSTAILEHIGNTKSARRLLSGSNTLTYYYDKLSLNDPVVREMFVTMIFALSPEFVKMVDKSLSIAIDRSTSTVEAPYAENQMANALVSLESTGLITKGEMIKAASMDSREVKEVKRGRGRIISKSLDSTVRPIIPTDSISNADEGANTYVEEAIIKGMPRNEKDIQDYLKRRRTLRVPDFNDVFNDSRPPIAATTRRGRAGLGYNERTDSTSYITNAMNNILGSKTVASYNLRSGEPSIRRPRVEDFVESESIADTVLLDIPDVATDYTQNYNMVSFAKPEPTETILMNSTPRSSPKNSPKLKTFDSIEALRDKIANSG